MLPNPIFAFCLATFGLAVAATAAEPLPPASQWVPPDAIVSLQVSQPKALLDLALDPKVLAAVGRMPAYHRMTQQPKYREMQAGVAFLEGVLNTDWPAALRKLTGEGIQLSLHPNGGVLVIVDADDAELLARLHGVLIPIARSEVEKQGQPNRVSSKDYQGVEAWTFSGEEAHAIVGNRLIWASKPHLLKAALDLRAKAGSSLASLPAYQSAVKAAGEGAAAVGFVNMAVLQQNPAVKAALDKTENPLAAILFAGLRDALRQSKWLLLKLQVNGETLSLRATIDSAAGVAAKASAFARPAGPGEGVLPNLAVPRRIAAMSLYRDLHAFYAAKDELFPDRTSGLIFFENMMGIFFTGKDLTEEVLGQTRPEVRVVVAQQQYDPAVGTPRVQVPAFALVFRLRNPKEFDQVAEEAWQKALGLVNFTRGQQALPGLIIDRPTHDGTQFTVAAFAAPKAEEKQALDVRYNFRPALAMVGDALVFSSTESLARDLIDTLKKEQAGKTPAVAGTDSLLELDGQTSAAALAANRDNLVRNNMLEKGHTQEQAEGEIDFLTTIVESLTRAKLDVASHEGQTSAALEIAKS